ncbi:hypothetical protein [Streptomyces hyaluromycini]|nr:hypothetical protein [Streptomyces hyaluromycini]
MAGPDSGQKRSGRPRLPWGRPVTHPVTGTRSLLLGSMVISGLTGLPE